MTGMETWKRCICLLMLFLLLFAPAVQVSAEETAETAVTETPEETAVPEETQAPEQIQIPEETQLSRQAELPEVTEAPDEAGASEGQEEGALQLPEPVLTVAEVLSKQPGAETLQMEATVVFASGSQAVLQDATGGIRLSFAAAPDIALGDVLLVTGYRRASGFGVEAFEKTGISELPEQEADLTEGLEALRILVKGAVLEESELSQKGLRFHLVGTIPAGVKDGDRVDVQGVMLDGVFYADTITRSENQEPEQPVPEGNLEGNWNFYFGQLHAHTDISDGTGTVEEAFAYARQVDHLDFFAVTDHSNAFDNADQGTVDGNGSAVSREWAAGKSAAEAVTDGSFVGIFGYEMTWPEDKAIGHISTFGTPGWQTRDQEGMHKLKGYLDALAAVPDSVSQFNHPGAVYGDFKKFSEYTPQYDARMHLLEVGSGAGITAQKAYTQALDAGWHLAPSNNQNNHNGSWGDVSQARTVVLAEKLTEAAIYDAVRSCRVYATEDADLKILYRLNDRIMGSIMPEEERLQAEILLEDGSGDPIGRVEVITDGGAVAAFAEVSESSGECTLEIEKGGSYYYLRILRNDKIAAVTAPVWLERYEDLGIRDLTADVDKPVQGTEVNLSLTLYNEENLPFVVEQVTFAVGPEEIAKVEAPGSVAPLGELAIPLSYQSDLTGAVTIAATVQGSIAGQQRSYQKSITLRFRAPEAETKRIEEVRDGILGDAYRIRGYVTAGTSNPHNTFPDSIYLQDSSGGIEIMDFHQEGIQLGTPMEVEGILRSQGGNLVLAMTDYRIPEGNSYRFVPRTMSHGEAMDYDAHGGELLQLEGHVVSLTKTPDQLGVSRFTIRDAMGQLATVAVEAGIGSGAYGTNRLAADIKMSRSVRAIGLLHIDEYGEPVLRVRNCDEVAYVPPKRDPSNPKTGDWLGRLLYGK